MKKILLMLTLLVASPSYADGLYDGVWTTPGPYATIYQSGNEILIVVLEPDLSEWQPLLGTISNGLANVSSIAGSTSVKLRINFTSPNAATVTVDSCTPVQDCDFPTGTVFSAVRLM